jgi:hypothetical protein
MDFTFTQVAAEIPYMVIQPLIFTAIVYPMVGFQLAVKKFFSFALMILIFMDCTLYGLMAVALTPTAEIATGLSLTIFVVWNFFSGFIVTVKVTASLACRSNLVVSVKYQIFDRTPVSQMTTSCLIPFPSTGNAGVVEVDVLGMSYSMDPIRPSSKLGDHKELIRVLGQPDQPVMTF